MIQPNLQFTLNILFQMASIFIYSEDSFFSSSRKFQLTAQDSPMCQILGRIYYSSDKTNQQLQEELNSLIFFSYRKSMKEFQYLSTYITSDSGWGCSLRTAQMMIAQAFKRHLFEKRVQSFTLDEKSVTEYKYLISMFNESRTVDDMSQSPFGFHSLLTQTINLFQLPLKSWYTPVQGIKALKRQFKEQKLVTNLKIVTTSQGVLFKEDVRQKMKSWEKSLLLIMHFKVGVDKINQTQIEQLKQLMDLEYFVGGIAGIKSKSLFMIGYMNNQFLSLDPHLTQNATKNSFDLSDDELSTFFPKKIRADSCNKYSGDVTIAFYIRTEKQYNIFIQKIKSLIQQYSPSSGECSENEFFMGLEDQKFDVNPKYDNIYQEDVIDLT